jgi:hypothetical protein
MRNWAALCALLALGLDTETWKHEVVCVCTRARGVEESRRGAE